MKVLLSIKPHYANLIFDGVKKYEFRRSIFKEKVNTIVVYASSPLQKVIGEFEIETILNENLQSLWEKTEAHAGVDKAFFFQYFVNKQHGFAIKIKSTKRYEKPLCLKDDYKLSPPQSFLYLTE
ncbi:hypothetical protein [Mucilaginibacter sp. CSA2-8R]|uniref:hypothetical protein n=1 Tax=Mucilaginibacter sp. CSA2-8R TaxID=3141542 RepID=UPI00315D7D74